MCLYGYNILLSIKRHQCNVNVYFRHGKIVDDRASKYISPANVTSVLTLVSGFYFTGVEQNFSFAPAFLWYCLTSQGSPGSKHVVSLKS